MKMDSVSSSVKKHSKGSYASVNGLSLYYETYGDAVNPLVLLHGGLGEMGMFGDVLPLLAQDRQVITVDLQAHGRTADADRPLSYEFMADDIRALLQQLGLERADVMGYSLGGGVALQTAIRHPDWVRKLVIVSTPCKSEGWYPEVLGGMRQLGPEMAEALKQTPMYAVYVRVAPRIEDWPVLLAKSGQLHQQSYDWSVDFTKIQVPTLIVAGDADSVRTAHAVEMFEMLGGGKVDAGWDGSGMSRARLAILPGMTHYNIFSSPVLANTAKPFLDAPMPIERK